MMMYNKYLSINLLRHLDLKSIFGLDFAVGRIIT